MIRRIFSDMDGTILNGSGHVSERTAAAIKRSRIPFTLVSARAPIEMQESVHILNLHGPQIAFNGGLIFTPGEDGIDVISERYVPGRTARTLISAIVRHFPQVSVSLYDAKHWYAQQADAGVRMEQKLTGQTAQLVQWADLLRDDLPVFKIMLITFDPQIMVALHAYINGLGITGISVQQSGDQYLEITSGEAKKSRGIRYIFDRFHLSRADTAAFGDGHNDLPMLNMVGYPIVMANALPEIKAVAVHVTSSNDADGIAAALKEYAPLQR